MKSEPSTFSLEQLKKEKESLWDGVRNYQARNFMMNDMKKSDLILFYHSNTTPPAVVGLAEVSSSQAVADITALDKNSNYFDPKATKDNPRWHCVKVKYKKKFSRPITLKEIKTHPKLKTMMVAQKGQRLSIQPVEKKHFELILRLSGSELSL